MGRLENTSNEHRIFFLMQFTKEVLRNSASYDVETLEKILKQKTKDIILNREREKERNKKDLEELIKKRKSLLVTQPKVYEKKSNTVSKISEVKIKTHAIEEDSKPSRKIISPISGSHSHKINSNFTSQKNITGVNIPVSTYQNVTPRPTNEKIDLGDLNVYIDDPTISSIECNGPDTLLLIRRGREIKRTDFALTSDQIQEIIRAFSKASKIPVNEGVFRVAVGRVILTAQVSGDFGTKFIMSKMY